jgi:hypothetical protein
MYVSSAEVVHTGELVSHSGRQTPPPPPEVPPENQKDHFGAMNCCPF